MTDEIYENSVVRKTISLRLKEEKLIERVMKNYGLDFSSAVRFIVNDWASDLSNVYWRDASEIAVVLSD